MVLMIVKENSTLVNDHKYCQLLEEKFKMWQTRM